MGITGKEVTAIVNRTTEYVKENRYNFSQLVNIFYDIGMLQRNPTVVLNEI